MRCLVDTGILLRLFDRSDPQCQSCREAVANLLSHGYELLATVQNAAEFINVSTRPTSARGGYGHPVDKALRRLRVLESAGGILSESASSYLIWKDLVESHSVSGVSVHDARLVSVMKSEGVAHLLTLDAGDFERYKDISILTPDVVIADSGELSQ